MRREFHTLGGGRETGAPAPKAALSSTVGLSGVTAAQATAACPSDGATL